MPLKRQLLDTISDDIIFHLLDRQEVVVSNSYLEVKSIDGMISQKQRDIQLLQSARQTHDNIARKQKRRFRKLSVYARERHIDYTSLAAAKRESECKARRNAIKAKASALKPYSRDASPSSDSASDAEDKIISGMSDSEMDSDGDDI